MYYRSINEITFYYQGLTVPIHNAIQFFVFNSNSGPPVYFTHKRPNRVPHSSLNGAITKDVGQFLSPKHALSLLDVSFMGTSSDPIIVNLTFYHCLLDLTQINQLFVVVNGTKNNNSSEGRISLSLISKSALIYY